MVGGTLKQEKIFPDTVRWGDAVMVKENHDGFGFLLKEGDLGLVVFVDSGEYPFVIISWEKLPLKLTDVVYDGQKGQWVPSLVKIDLG